MELATASVSRHVKIKKRGLSLSPTLVGMALLFVLSAFIVVGSIVMADTRELAVVAGKSFPVDTLTLDNVKEIYRGEKKIIAGIRLKPIDQRGSQPIRLEFLNKVVHFSEDEYVMYWNNRLFRDGGIPPTLKNNSAEVIMAVEETVGAIGYVWLDETTAAKTDLKILLRIHALQ